MSLAISEPQRMTFFTRFEGVWTSLRRYQIRQGLAWTCLAAALGLGALVVADYRLELPRDVRAAGLGALSVLILAVLWLRVVSPMRWWTQPRTAAEIEGRFPQLGQRIRTVVQFAGLPAELIYSQGVTPSLVDALEEETEVRAQPLPLERVVPWRRVWAVGAAAAAPALLLCLAAVFNVEWRIAIERTLLFRRAYTTVSVEPGNVTIEQGESVPLIVQLTGRIKRDVVLYARPRGQADAPWEASALPVPDEGPASKRASTLEKVRDPIEYRVAAGPALSPTYAIEVRYPLAVKTFDVALKPPAYTGVAPSTVKGGDLRVIEGTGATFQITFDAPPAEASLVLTDPSPRSRKDKTTATRVIPLKPTGAKFTAELGLTRGLVYLIEARTADGRALPKNSYRIDVVDDRPPRVAFDEPDEALEVHPIAEVVNRIRVADDFGLTKAGIVFQFNAGDEQTLVARDFKPEPARLPTSAALEEMMLLEKLAASPTDSLSYYAFAEDNYPAGARRTETELRFIDIRPFKREYKQMESDDGGMEGTDEFATLGELIARQRFNLNRAQRLARHKPGDKAVGEDSIKITGFEEMLAGLTREFTEGVEGIVGQRIEPLHAAEEAMLGSITALDQGHNEQAPVHMSQALRHLIQARDTLRVAIGDDGARARAMRSYDRSQAQKIRKKKKDAELAEEIAEELEKLAEDEDFVYATLAGLQMEKPAEKGQKGQAAGAGTGDAEKKDAGDADKKDAGDAEKKDAGDADKKDAGDAEKKDTGDADNDKKEEDRKTAMERQEKIADKARELEEKLKKLEQASDLAKVRMMKAAEATEKTAGALTRGNTKEATETAKGGAAMLHELARQVKGEIAREVAEELAMARDLADLLAERAAELGQDGPPGSGDQGGSGTGGKRPGNRPGPGGRSGPGDLTDAERLERLEEAAKTLEQWLTDASRRAEGESANRIRELVEETGATQVVERMERIRELHLGGQKPAARRDATELSRMLEVLARRLDVLHRGIVAPELAALVEFDKRITELMARLQNVKTDGDIDEWHRQAANLIGDLEKAGLADAAAALAAAMAAEGWHGQKGTWRWAAGADDRRLVPAAYTTAIGSLTVYVHAKIQDLILKDMASARDEATPPEFKELVERYYEVLSKNSGSK
jgi:hypothetical protein